MLAKKYAKPVLIALHITLILKATILKSQGNSQGGGSDPSGTPEGAWHSSVFFPFSHIYNKCFIVFLY